MLIQMEQLKHSVRDFNAKQQHVQPLTKGPTYYRVSVDSAFADNDSITDTTFKMGQSLPNRRADLLNGDWEAFLESFTGTLPSLDGHKISVKVCLPDLVASSQDSRVEFEAPATYRVHNDNTVGIVPLPHQFAAPGHANGAVVLADAYKLLPLSYSKAVGVHDIGRKVNANMLFTGELRVVLRDEHDDPLTTGNGAGEMGVATDFWQATFLFVHKP